MRNRFNILYNPEVAWPRIAEKKLGIGEVYLRFVIVMAAIPPVSAFIGTVYSGWRVGLGEPVKLTWESALVLCIAAYVAILIGVYVFSRFVHWMAKTYDSEATLEKAFVLVVYSGMPLFIVSIFSAYPILWLNTLLTLVAAALSIRILFIGTPFMMGINQEKGFMFANSILVVGMVMTVAILVISVLFWGLGVGPSYTR